MSRYTNAARAAMEFHKSLNLEDVKAWRFDVDRHRVAHGLDPLLADPPWILELQASRDLQLETIYKYVESRAPARRGQGDAPEAGWNDFHREKEKRCYPGRG